MPVRCVALLSGGLDSMLAVRLMQDQQIEVHALNFQTVFTCCQDQSARAARQLDVPLTVIAAGDEYLDLVRKPRFGYGRAANPCVDCRIAMFQGARRFMEQAGAQLVISGEVLGQRPMSQKRRDLDVIARHSGLEDFLLRPLSAKLLPATRPEREGLVDRERLCGFSGRGRKAMIGLARGFGLPSIPAPSTGCALTEVGFSRKVFDLVDFQPQSQRWDFDLLRVGRHFRLNHGTKLVVGRNEDENARLRYLFQLPQAVAATLLEPQGFAGPNVLMVGPLNQTTTSEAVALMLQHSRQVDAAKGRVIVTHGTDVQAVPLPAAAAVSSARNVTDSAANIADAG